MFDYACRMVSTSSERSFRPLTQGSRIFQDFLCPCLKNKVELLWFQIGKPSGWVWFQALIFDDHLVKLIVNKKICPSQNWQILMREFSVNKLRNLTRYFELKLELLF